MLQARGAVSRRGPAAEIEAALARVVAGTRFLADPSPEGGALLPDELRCATREFILAGRGRVRPRLLVEMHDALSRCREDSPEIERTAVLDAAVSVELLHLFTLVHDDIVDESPERSGRPTLRAVAAAHGHGDSIALVLGDLLFARAMQVLTALPAPAPVVCEAMNVFTAEALAAGAGQLDELMAGVARPWRAARSSRQKTAPQGFRLPLCLGALLADATPQARRALARAGDDLGAAYQLADDLTELSLAAAGGRWPDAERGAPALVIAIALARLEPPRRQRLEALLGREGLSVAEERARVELVLISGAVDSVAQRIELLLARARERVAREPDLPAAATAPVARVGDRITAAVECALDAIRDRRS